MNVRYPNVYVAEPPPRTLFTVLHALCHATGNLTTAPRDHQPEPTEILQ